MKSTLKEKFKNNVIVKPLYKKLKNGNRIKPKILMDSTFKLDGDEINVKRNILNNGGVSNGKIRKDKTIFLSGRRDNNKNLFDKVNERDNVIRKGCNMISAIDNRKPNREVEGIKDKTNQLVQADNEMVVVEKVPNTWLRFYPAAKLPKESIGSVIFRCVLCQLGLCTILILWTIVWVFVIHSFEGPNEIKVSSDFEKEQNLLVINLATELRQITPLSPKWRSAIERRIQDERRLTMEAVSHGARVHPGQYWDLSGTFLFTVYVMTALGFGAPVPQTIWGRTSALIYATFAVPTHFYLMLNASMCVVVRVEAYLRQLRCSLRDKRPSVLGRTTIRSGVESPNCSRSSEVLKSPNRCGMRKKIMCFLGVLGACRSVPLIAVLYYMCGAAVFGWARGNTPQDIAMFPLEFTTSGGLDRCGILLSVPIEAISFFLFLQLIIPQVEGHVRILYGIYVEGAMMLLSCGLATLRRHSGAAVTCMTEKFRLIKTEE